MLRLRGSSGSIQWLIICLGVFVFGVTTVITRAAPLGASCIDDDVGFEQYLAQKGFKTTNGCVEAIEYCASDDDGGKLAQRFCCNTCSATNKGSNGGPNDEFDNVFLHRVPENDLPATGKPLKLFLLGGQSECLGHAQSADLFNSSDYPQLQGTIEGVWFAGYYQVPSPGTFFIAPLSADLDRAKFGPEVSFGERIYNATGGTSNIMMVKYCEGSTDVQFNWNPLAPENRWNINADDGTADWLESRTYLNDYSAGKSTEVKRHQFVNMIYTIRRTKEALQEAGIPYEWSGIVWLQGMADNDPENPSLWETFGRNTARVWEGFRHELERGDDPAQTSIPIIDTGASNLNQLKSGKEYATQIVDGGLAKNVEYGVSASDDTGSCRITPSNPCVDGVSGEASGFFQQLQLFDHFGYDPKSLEFLIQSSSEINKGDITKTFDWFVSFPDDMHSAYEGMILKGRMLANAFLREFSEESEYDLGFEENDVAELFPFRKCPEGDKPSDGNICWIDYREGRFNTLPPSMFPTESQPPSVSARPSASARPSRPPKAPKKAKKSKKKKSKRRRRRRRKNNNR